MNIKTNLKTMRSFGINRNRARVRYATPGLLDHAPLAPGAGQLRRISWVTVFSLFSVLTGGTQLSAQQLSYYGGPVLDSFTIYPLYYGPFQQDMTDNQNYLTALAAYMSGTNAPEGQRPTSWQYGVKSVRVAPYTTSSTPDLGSPHPLTPKELLNIIHTNQTPGSKVVCTPPPYCHPEPVPAKLPPYSRNTLIVVFLGKGYSLSRGSPSVGYHSSESPSSFFAFFPDYGSDVTKLRALTAHEILEAATDPAGMKTTGGGTNGLDCLVFDGNQGWEYFDKSFYTCEVPNVPTPPIRWAEAVDNCNTTFSFNLGTNSWTIQGIHDNTQGGACSTTGYINWAHWTAATISSGHVVVPDDSVVGGQDIDGNALYVCRSGVGWSTQYGQTPGKYQVNFTGCHFAFGGYEREAPDFEFLVSSWSSISNGTIPAGAVQGGAASSGTPLYFCRSSSAATGNSLTPGYIGAGTGGCKVSYGGVSVTLTSYEVLVRMAGNPLPLSTLHVADGSVPLETLRGGKDSDSTPLYLCSAQYGGSKYPGKLRADFSNCLIAVAGQEVWVPTYDVLVPSWAGFSTSTPIDGFVTGRDVTDGITSLYSCRSSALGGMQTGTMVGAGCDVGFAGTAYHLSPPFDVLSSK